MGRALWAPSIAIVLTMAASLVGGGTPGGLGPSVAAAQSGGTFTAAERAALARGQLVTRREARRRGNLLLIGGTAWQVINAPPEAVWRAVLDTPRYNRMLPEVVEARQVQERDGSRLVYIRHQQGPLSASYHIQLQYVPGQRVAQFRVDRSRPHAIREGWGFFNVQPYQGNRTLISYGIMADVGSGIFGGLFRPRIHEWMLRVPETVKRFVEGAGRARYNPRH